MARAYCVLVAKSEAGLHAAAGDDWTILENTIKNFAELDTDDDDSLGDVGRVMVPGEGWVALAYQELE
jgi:hypothetical protein